MIIFAVQTNLVFNKKPKWLDSFKNQYNNTRYDYHVTLKQVSIVSDDQVQKIRKILSEYFEKVNPQSINLKFNKLVLNDGGIDSGEACIMIESEHNDEINRLQKDIVGILSEYKNYFWPESKTWEENFIPHITIAMNLDAEKFSLAKQDLKDNYACEGKATQVILSVVHNFDPKNKSAQYHDDSIYKLRK